MKSVGGTATQPDFYKGSADVDKILFLYNFFRILSAQPNANLVCIKWLVSRKANFQSNLYSLIRLLEKYWNISMKLFW